MNIILEKLSDFKYKKTGSQFKLEFGGEASDLIISEQWHKLTGIINQADTSLTITPISAPASSDFHQRFESDFHVINGTNMPRLELLIQNNPSGNPTLYAFIGNDDADVSRTHYSGIFLEISNNHHVYFTVENDTFIFYYSEKN